MAEKINPYSLNIKGLPAERPQPQQVIVSGKGHREVNSGGKGYGNGGHIIHMSKR